MEKINDFKLLLSMAEMGDIDAQVNLASVYGNSSSIYYNQDEALWWYELAAENGSCSAQIALGFMYLSEAYECFDLEKSLYWLLRALNNSDLESDILKMRTISCMIGEIYHSKYDDKLNAIFYYKKAAELGSNSAIRMLVSVYESIARDNGHELLRLARKAADEAPYMYQMIGELYLGGNGITQDYSEALKYFKLASEAGVDKAFYDLGELYYNGLGVPQNYEEAARCYRLSSSYYTNDKIEISQPTFDDRELILPF